MENEKDILEFKNGKVNSIDNSMKKVLFIYLKQKAFFVLMVVLILCFIGSYSILDNSSRITIIIAIIFFLSFYFIFNKLMNKKTKRGGIEKNNRIH